MDPVKWAYRQLSDCAPQVLFDRGARGVVSIWGSIKHGLKRAGQVLGGVGVAMPVGTVKDRYADRETENHDA